MGWDESGQGHEFRVQGFSPAAATVRCPPSCAATSSPSPMCIRLPQLSPQKLCCPPPPSPPHPPPPQESGSSRAECLLERAMIYQRRRDFRRACADLTEGVKLDPKNHQVGGGGGKGGSETGVGLGLCVS